MRRASPKRDQENLYGDSAGKVNCCESELIA